MAYGCSNVRAAFAFHTACDCLEALWTQAREAKRARKRFFEHVRTLAAYLASPTWDTLTWDTLTLALGKR